MKYISKYDRISIYTAAVVIGKNVNWVRWALQDHLVPFGELVRVSPAQWETKSPVFVLHQQAASGRIRFGLRGRD